MSAPPMTAPPVTTLSIPALPSLRLIDNGGRSLWIVADDETRGWDGTQWVQL